jgi:hypothetical protein
VTPVNDGVVIQEDDVESLALDYYHAQLRGAGATKTQECIRRDELIWFHKV